MRIAISTKQLHGKERKEILEAVQQQAKAAALQAIKPILTGFLEAEVALKLGREKGATRQISSQKREIDWACGSCGCQDAHQFTRAGHYKRNLETGWGHVQDFQVPLLECQQCHQDGICHFSILEKYQRFWLDAGSRRPLQQWSRAELTCDQPGRECETGRQCGTANTQ